jgi:hypothetical protein
MDLLPGELVVGQRIVAFQQRELRRLDEGPERAAF